MTDRVPTEDDDRPAESELYDGTEPVVEEEDGFSTRPIPDPSLLDSEVDFDDEELQDTELINAETAGNAEGGQDAHLEDPDEVGDDDTY